jgi:hypothetical protein
MNLRLQSFVVDEEWSASHSDRFIPRIRRGVGPGDFQGVVDMNPELPARVPLCDPLLQVKTMPSLLCAGRQSGWSSNGYS